MPVLIQKYTNIDGPRTAVIQVTIESDGSGELNLEKIIDATFDMYPIGRPTDTTIQQVWWGQSYFDSFLYTNDLVPQLLWVLPVGNDAHIDFRSIGGLKIKKTIDGNGDILMTTAGFAPLGSKGSYIFEIKKD